MGSQNVVEKNYCTTQGRDRSLEAGVTHLLNREGSREATLGITASHHHFGIGFAPQMWMLSASMAGITATTAGLQPAGVRDRFPRESLRAIEFAAAS